MPHVWWIARRHKCCRSGAPVWRRMGTKTVHEGVPPSGTEHRPKASVREHRRPRTDGVTHSSESMVSMRASTASRCSERSQGASRSSESWCRVGRSPPRIRTEAQRLAHPTLTWRYQTHNSTRATVQSCFTRLLRDQFTADKLMCLKLQQFLVACQRG